MPARTTRKLSAALERCARQIKDNDEFVAHIANIAARYRREHALAKGTRVSDVRKALRNFNKHAAALIDWLNAARKLGASSAQRTALESMGESMYGVPSHAHASSDPVRAWLAQARTAAEKRLTVKLDREPTAPRTAAAALRATFEHHKLKWSTAVTKQRQSDAVRLLLAAAKSAGDAALTVEAAREALRNTDQGTRL